METGCNTLSDTFRRMSATLDQNSQVLLTSLHTLKEIVSNHSLTGDPTTAYGEITRNDRVIVEIKVTFLKIVDVDTVSQEFQADIFLQAKWEEPAFVKYSSKNYPMFDPKSNWDPKLIILNNEDMYLDRKSFCVRYEKGYKYPVVLLLWRFKGRFRENMELQHFPFDVQDLTIQVCSERPINHVELIEDQQNLSTVNTETFLDAGEWNIYNHVESFRDKTTMEYASLSVHPILYTQCRVRRKVGYFMWNITVIVLLITILTFTSMAIEPSNGDRIGVSITLFLTAVAFKLVVKQSLPTISYLTYLDIYILALLVFQSISTAENAAMCALGRTLSVNELQSWDNWSQATLALVLVLFHLFFWIHIQTTALRRRRLMVEKDRLYQKKKRYMERSGKRMTNPGFASHGEKHKDHP